MLAVALIVLVGAVACWFLRRPNGRGAPYQLLLTLTMGDRATAERLIAYEARSRPSASRRVLIRHAIARWRHDNG